MTPSRFAASLRSIADKIDRSKRPSRRLVTSTIEKLLVAIDMNVIDELMPDEISEELAKRGLRKARFNPETGEFEPHEDVTLEDGTVVKASPM